MSNAEELQHGSQPLPEDHTAEIVPFPIQNPQPDTETEQAIGEAVAVARHRVEEVMPAFKPIPVEKERRAFKPVPTDNPKAVYASPAAPTMPNSTARRIIPQYNLGHEEKNRRLGQINNP